MFYLLAGISFPVFYFFTRKSDLENVTSVDISSFALKANLASLKAEADKLDIDQLIPVSVNLRKLSDFVTNDVVKKDVFDKLAPKVNNIDTSEFVLKTIYQKDLERKIPDVTDFVKNTKLTELENKISDVISLATKGALTAVKNKTPYVISLVKKNKLWHKN